MLHTSATPQRAFSALAAACFALASCSGTDDSATVVPSYPAVERTFAGKINLNSLANYNGQARPIYIVKDLLGGTNPSNAKATLGRVLFYDKKLSSDNTIACATCHVQALGFSDDEVSSTGIAGGKTGRHGMRLINSRFGQEVRFFWDERATSLQNQVTQPVKDVNEMGFSGTSGQPAFSTLLTKLAGTDYYQELFTFVYGDATVTEARIQDALSQFIFSIQSFDSKYDVGRAAAPNDAANFANFTAQENQGKTLYLQAPAFAAGGLRTGGGAGCQGCHRAPEFDIDQNSQNNGIVGVIGGGTDLIVTRSPSLRDLVRVDGTLNGQIMHTGEITTLAGVIEHYNSGISLNAQLDPRLRPGGNPQRLQLTQAEKDALVAFLRTLSGTSVYSDARWSTPF